MLGIGIIGSPLDVATFVSVLVLLKYELRADLETLSAGVVALARGRQDVDHAQLRADLEVDERDVRAVRTPTATDGGERGD